MLFYIRIINSTLIGYHYFRGKLFCGSLSVFPISIGDNGHKGFFNKAKMQIPTLNEQCILRT